MNNHIEFILNDKNIKVYDNTAKTLLDFIRTDAGLKGTKEGCREGDCGACTVLIGEIINGELKYKSINSCLSPIGNAMGKHVVTIEGLNSNNLTPIQKEFNNEGSTQCGFCTPGFVTSLTGYVIENNSLNDIDAKNSIAGNICRCTGYSSIIRTAENVVVLINSLNFADKSRINSLVNNNIIPKYFLGIEEKLKQLNIDQSNINVANNIIVGGGTDLFVQKAEALLSEKFTLLNDINLTDIKVINGFCHVGAGVTIEQLKNSKIIQEHFPSMANKLNLFASLPIRNSATIGGNIVNASPIGDSTSIFLALNSYLIITSKNNKREIQLSNFYKGYKEIDLLKEEFIEEIVFELPNKHTKFNFEKVSKRTHLDIASVNTSIKIEVEENNIQSISISAGGVSPIPLLLYKTSNYLKMKSLNSATILEAINIAQLEISPIDDIRGSTEYKNLLLTQLIKAHFITLFPNEIDVESLL